MPCHLMSRRLLATTPTTQPSSYIWISDSHLQSAFDRFARIVHKRHGSNTPGPLEAQRRIAKRKLAGLTVHAPPVVDLASLFGTKRYEADWQFAREPSQVQSPLPDVLLQPVQQRTVIRDREHRSHESLLQALFGRRDENGGEKSSDAAQSGLSLEDLLARDAPFEEVMNLLRDPFQSYTTEHKLLEFLDLTASRSLSVNHFSEYAKCVESAIILGTMDLLEIEGLLDRVDAWINTRWSEEERHKALALILIAVWSGLHRCRVQVPDVALLHKLLSMLKTIKNPPLSVSRYILDVYRACWPCTTKASRRRADIKQQIIYWIDLVRKNEQKPQIQDTRFAFSHSHLVSVVQHLFLSTSNDHPSMRTISFDSYESKDDIESSRLMPGVIQQVTYDLCSTTDSIDGEVNLPESDRYVQRGHWLRAVFEAFECSLPNDKSQEIVKMTNDSNGRPIYTCPTMWYDILDEITRTLPLQAALRYMPKLEPQQVCRLALIFSFGPQTYGQRLSMVPTLFGVVATAVKERCLAALEFERSLQQSSSLDDPSVYCSLLSALSKHRKWTTSIEEALLVPALRITSIINDVKGDAGVLNFVLSPELHEVITKGGTDNNAEIIRARMVLKLAAIAYSHQDFHDSNNDFVRAIWTFIVDNLKDVRINFKGMKLERRKTIHREWVRNNFDRLIGHLAMHAANDQDLTDRRSYHMVEFFRLELLGNGLVLLEPIQVAMISSAFLRPLSKNRTIPHARVRHVFRILELSGMSEDRRAKIMSIVERWVSGIEKTHNQGKKQGRLAVVESVSPGREPSIFNDQKLPGATSSAALCNMHTAPWDPQIMLTTNRPFLSRKTYEKVSDDDGLGTINDVNADYGRAQVNEAVVKASVNSMSGHSQSHDEDDTSNSKMFHGAETQIEDGSNAAPSTSNTRLASNNMAMVPSGLIRYVEHESVEYSTSQAPISGKRLSLLAHTAKRQLAATRRLNDVRQVQDR